MAEIGEAFRNGVMLAYEESEKYDKVDLIIEDSGYDPAKAISAYRKLNDIDHVDVILNWGDPTSQALAPLAEMDKMPFLAFTASTNITAGREYTIRTMYKIDDIATSLLNFFRQNEYKKIGILKFESQYFNEIETALQRNLQSENGETVEVIDSYVSPTESTRGSLMKIQRSPYDVVGVLFFPGQLRDYYTNANTMGVRVPTFAPDGIESSSLTDIYSLTNNVVYSTLDVSEIFRKKYVEKYGMVSHLTFAGNAYDIASLVLSAADYTNKETFLKSLRAVTGYEGLTGVYVYAEEGNDKRIAAPVVVKSIVGDQTMKVH